MCEYSQAEIRLIEAIDPSWGTQEAAGRLVPGVLYTTLAVKCFMDKRIGPEVNALRRVLAALQESKIYRLTPDFDKLCEFEE